jgi:hypothetical protein
MLGWLAVAAAPLLIHLLSRRRHRQAEWAAMQFLLAAMRESRRRIRLEHLTMLIIRTLIVVFVVLAVADPYLESHGLFFKGGATRTHRVFVLDASYSMAYTVDDESRFAQAKALITRIVRASPQGDAFSLILMAQPPRSVVDTPALEPAEFLRELETAPRTDGTADLPATVEQVASVLETARHTQPGLERQEVYFLSDLCRVGWLPRLSAAERREFVKQAVKLGKSASLSVIDLGQPGADNLAITRLSTSRSYVTPAQGANLNVTLRNFGTQNREGQTVELLVDSQRVARQIVNLPAGKSRSITFSHRFDRPGDHVVEVKLEVDRLLVDNRRWLVLPVRPKARVLCVDGRSGGELGGATFYLKTALLATEGKGRTSAIDARVVPESALLEVDLSPYDCVFLCDVAQVTSNEAKVLRDYVRAGGGLVFFLGPRVLADRYNLELFERQHLLPAMLHGAVENRTAGIDPRGYAHPIVEPFRGQEKAGLLTVPIERYVKMTLPKKTKARVVASTRTGDPLIVEQPVGRGRVVVVATSADTAWTLMPLWPSYVPVVREILKYAAAGRVARRNRLVGEALDGVLPDTSAEPSGRIRLPDGKERLLPLRHEDGYERWSYDETGRSGVYEVAFGGEQQRWSPFGVNVDTVESDLAKVTEAHLREQVWPGVAFDYRTTWKASNGPSAEPTLHRSAPARWLLFGALILLLVETFLAWRFGHHGTTPAEEASQA